MAKRPRRNPGGLFKARVVLEAIRETIRDAHSIRFLRSNSQIVVVLSCIQ